VLVHIGPHKTGTTTVQFALDDARQRLAKSGVCLLPQSRHPRGAFLAGTGAAGLHGEAHDGQAEWDQLVERAQTTGGRAVVSSEILTSTRVARIPGLVADLGGDRVQIVITVRPLVRILPSQWQEHLNNRLSTPYPDWLEEVFRQPESENARRFWRRHDHVALLERWAGAVGIDRLSVVVADDSNPRAVLDAFESLLALEPRTLRLPARTNRSLSLGEAELMRLLNAEANRLGWPDDRYADVVRRNLFDRLKARLPVPADTPIPPPGWLRQELNKTQAETVRKIASTGVRVVGDLDRLKPAPNDAPEMPADVPLAAMTELVAGLVLRDAPAGSAGSASTRALLRIVLARSARTAGRRLARRPAGDS
jgi:hypothetical protein